MNEWHREWYGDPCRECGFDWSIGFHASLELASGIPDRCAETLEGHSGAERAPDLSWCAGEYVCHIVDNFRIWAERLAAAGLGGSAVLVTYDSDGLATARAYRSVPIEGSLWSLRQAEREWREAVRLAGASGVVLVHPDRGEQSIEEVVRGNVHDAVHHHWDIVRSIASA